MSNQLINNYNFFEMKKIKFVISFFAFMCLSLLAVGQLPTKSLYQKYSSVKGFSLVTINKDLFNVLSEINDETKSESGKEINQIINNLDYINILMFDARKSDDPKFLEKFKEEINLLNLANYSELMMVKEEEEEVKIFTLKEKEEIKELVLLISEPQQAGFISIAGNINLKSIGKIARALNIQGLENLEKINTQEEK